MRTNIKITGTRSIYSQSESIQKKFKNYFKNLDKEDAKIYDNIELNGITRSEFIIVNQIPHILETNTIPGFTKQSIIPQQIEVQKLSVKEVLYNQIKLIL